jgi:TRAP-type transport system periplasmic protein
MKTSLKIVLFAALLLVLTIVPALAACGSGGAVPTSGPVKAVQLTYSNFFPATHLNSLLANEWIKEVCSQSNGQISTTLYPGGSLTPAAKIYDGVVNGISDLGMSACAYTVGRFPATELIDLPHKYPNGWVATQVANDFYQHFTPAEFSDTQVLYFHGHGPGVILTTKKPVRTLEDMKGLVIRSTGIGAKIVEALGGQGYGAAQNAAYELMSKGTIDGSYTPREVLKGWNQAEVVNYVTGCYDVGNTTSMFVVMNSDKFKSLPQNVQQVIMDVSQEWYVKHGMAWDYYDKVAIDYFMTFPGHEVIKLSDSEMARWVDAVEPLVASSIDAVTAKGLPGAEYEQYINERVAYWSAKAPTADQSVSWVEENLGSLMPK